MEHGSGCVLDLDMKQEWHSPAALPLPLEQGSATLVLSPPLPKPILTAPQHHIITSQLNIMITCRLVAKGLYDSSEGP